MSTISKMLEKATAQSILSNLKFLGRCDYIYSGHRQSIYGPNQGNDLYVYCDEETILIVALDYFPNAHHPELADEEFFAQEPPQYFTEYGHRQSPVWQLLVTTEIMRGRLARIEEHLNDIPPICSVWLTNSEIINEEDMWDEWKFLDVKVFCNLKEIRKGTILPVNPNEQIESAFPISFFINCVFDHTDISLATQKLLSKNKQKAVSIGKKGKCLPITADEIIGIDKTMCNLDVEDITVQILHKDDYLYTNSTIEVTITGAAGTWFDPDSYSFVMCTDDYVPVCHNEEEKRHKGNVLILRAHPNLLLPGQYVIVVKGQIQPHAQIALHIGENFQLAAEPYRQISANSEGVVLSYLQQYDIGWDSIATIPGWESLRRHLVLSQRIEMYNDMSEDDDEKIIMQKNLILCTLSNQLNEEQLSLVAEQLDAGFKVRMLDCSLLFDGMRGNPYERLSEELSSFGSMSTVCLTNLQSLLSSAGKVIVKKVEEKIGSGQNCRLWLIGSEREVAKVLNAYPALCDMFVGSPQLIQKPATAYEILSAFMQVLRRENIMFDDEEHFVQTLYDGYLHGQLSTWATNDIRRYVIEEMRPLRIQTLLSENSEKPTSQLSFSTFNFEGLTGKTSGLNEAFCKLDEMVGLEEMKQALKTMANQVRFAMERKRFGLPTSHQNTAYHCIFTGNPGTGKTTVAHLIGKIYKAIGLLSKGDVVSVDRKALVGQYIGETEQNMNQILERARGNVLFIDEAYTLFTSSNDRKDYGNRVIESLLTVLSQPHDDMIVIFAGYEKEMGDLLSCNPGLTDRFPYKFRFPDFSEEELIRIAKDLLAHDQYILTEDGQRELDKCIHQAYCHRNKNFSNARWVTQLVFNGIIPEMADRLMESKAHDYQTIEVNDVKKGFAKFNPKVSEINPRPQVGYH